MPSRVGPPPPRRPITATTTQPGRDSLQWSCEQSLLTGSFDVDDAARTKFRVPRITADVAAQLIATHALGPLAGLHLDPYTRLARGNRRGGRRAGRDDLGVAGN